MKILFYAAVITALAAVTASAQDCTGVKRAKVGTRVCGLLAKIRTARTTSCSSSAASCAGSTASSQAQFVEQLNASNGAIYHDATYVGRENVYYSSDVATEADARQAWMKSRGHRANMPFINSIICNGNYCVGR